MRYTLSLLPLLAVAASPIHHAAAADLYWDTNGTTAGSGNAGGTWDTGSTSVWSTDATGVAAPGVFANGDKAIFSAGTDGTGSWTVNVTGTVQPSGITFAQDGTKTISGGLISVASNPLISAAGRNNGNNFNINSQLTGTGSLTLAANGNTSDTGGGVGGNITLGSTANDFIGNVTITSGMVNFASDGAFGNAANDIIIQGGGLVATANRTLPATRDIQLAGGGDKIFRAYGGVNFTINGAITGTGNVRHTDGGTLQLNGNNSFTGNLFSAAGSGRIVALGGVNTYTGYTHVLNSSTLRLDVDNALPDGAYNVFWGGTVFNVNGKTDTTGALTTGSASDTNVLLNLGAGGKLTVTNNNLVAGTTSNYANATWHGKITGTGDITYAHSTATGGAVHWDIMNTTNDFTGNWTVANGRLRVVSDAAFGNTANDITFDGAVVNTMNNQGGRASLQVTNGTSLTHGADRTFTLNTGKEGTFYVWGGTTQTISGLVTGGGNLRKEDGGILLLNNTGNNYGGETKIVTGTVRLGDNGVLPDTTLVRIGGGGGFLDTNGKTESIAGLTSVQPSDSVVLTDGSVSGTGTVRVLGSGSYEFGGSFGQGGGTTLIMDGAGTQTLSGNRDNVAGYATVNTGTLVLAKASSAGVHALGASGIAALTVNGGTARLAGTGGDQIYDDSLVAVNGGTFDLNERSESFRGLTGTGGTITSNGAALATITVGTQSIAGNVYNSASVIADGTSAVSLVKTGAGTQNLSGANTYTGATTVNGGRLNVNGSLASGTTVTVNAGAFLGGDGLISGNIALNGGLLPGQGGTTDRQLNVGGVITTSAGSSISFTLDSESSFDSLSVGGSIDLSNATLVITLNDTSFTNLGPGQGTNIAGASSYAIITGTTTGMFSNVTDTMTPAELSYFGLSGTQYKVSAGGQTFWVKEGSTTLVAIPEPSLALLAGLGLLGVSRRRRQITAQ